LKRSELKSELADFSTKGDIALLRCEMRELEARMTIKLGAMLLAMTRLISAIVIATMKYFIAP
jgi:hypothetical protein